MLLYLIPKDWKKEPTDPQLTKMYFMIPPIARHWVKGKSRVQPNLCGYQLGYAEGTSSKGDLAEESFTIGDSKSLKRIVFGCGHLNQGEGYEHYATGVIGLGDNRLSMIYQMPHQAGFTEKPTLPYHIEKNLHGRAQLNYKDNTIPPFGNMIVDVGSTYSYIHHKLFDRLKAKLEKAVGCKVVKARWEKGHVCLKARGTVLPSITFHFDGDMKLTLPPENNYRTVSLKTNIECLTILGNENPNGEAIFGVWGQANFGVGYDLEQKRIFFMEKDCTEY
ncbi:hypothetical protein Ddye_004174 [Dipteronia dyeriana]|uniref:Peptidase A1 domain-containing protein n=1 Tax=Dipteronia dyeriana TaxID=168575 RepID=A0AAD9XUF1_9ROSI|nr:hypothetical protein Ddye_004174 [Dipteronia dyeriana]